MRGKVSIGELSHEGKIGDGKSQVGVGKKRSTVGLCRVGIDIADCQISGVSDKEEA